MATLEPLRFRRIMVPVDESKPSQNSLAVAAGLARETGAQVILTHVVAERLAGSAGLRLQVGMRLEPRKPARILNGV